MQRDECTFSPIHERFNTIKKERKKVWEEAEKILLIELNNAIEEERKLIPRHLIV